MEVTGWLHTLANLYMREVPTGTPRICGWKRLRAHMENLMRRKIPFLPELSHPAFVLFNTQITLTKM
jgi:hypothetical protein